MKKKFFGAIIAMLIGLMIAIGASAKQAEATITCSAGSMGTCFTYGDAGAWIPWPTCVWTGRQADDCDAIGLAIRGYEAILALIPII